MSNRRLAGTSRKFSFRLTPIAAACLAFGFAPSALALELTWVGPATNGAWSSVSNWLTAGGQNAAPGVSDTVIFSTDAEITSGSAKSLFNSASLSMFGDNHFSGTLTNTGTLTVGGSSGSGHLKLHDGAVLAGSGETVLKSDGYLASASSGSKFTIDTGHTVRGNGSLIGDWTNKGTVIAEGGTLTIGSTFSNAAGLIKVADGATLSANGATISGATIKSLGNATVSGGTFSSSFEGGFTFSSASFAGSTLAGSNTLIGYSSSSGTLNNTGTLTVGGSSGSDYLRLHDGAVLAGSGETVLKSNGRLDNYSSGGKVTIDTGHTVRGNGQILSSFDGRNGDRTWINKGTVIAEGGTLTIGYSTFDNSAGLIKVADGATLSGGGTITGGTIKSLGNATVSDGAFSSSFEGGFTFSSASFAGSTLAGSNALIGYSSSSGTLNNTGTLTVGGSSGSGALSLRDGAVLAGSGETVLKSNGSLYISGWGDKATIDTGYTVRGNGQIGDNYNRGTWINKGTVIAEGGTLTIVSTFNNAAGLIKVTDGASLSGGGTISDGTIQGGSTDNGYLSSYSLDNVALSNKLAIVSGSSTYGEGTLTNTGTLTVGGSSGSGALSLRDGAVLAGSGETVLKSNGKLYAFNGHNVGGKATIDTGHTVRGNGQIGDNYNHDTWINKGTVIAEGGTLTISTDMTGSGKITVAADGVLSQNGGTVAIGTVEVATGGRYDLNGKLETTTLLGSFVQQGGGFGAGIGAGVSTLTGDYTLKAGYLGIDLADKTVGSFDQLRVLGNLSLDGGSLSVVTTGGYTVQAGDVFDIVSVTGSRSGAFSGLAEGSALNLGSNTLYLTYFGGDGNDISLVSKMTANSVNLASGSTDISSYAYVAGSYPKTTSGQTTALRGLDILTGGSYTLGRNETLNLDNGKGVLNVAQGAVFSGNGIINGNIRNAGLVRIPIVNIAQVTGGEVRIVADSPVIQTTAPVLVNQNTYVGFSYSGGSGGGGGCTSNCGSSIATPQLLTLAQASPVVRGTFAVDASLKVTGSYTQEETGQLRLFVGGNDQASFGTSKSGGTYSQLFVGEAVMLDGELQIVLQPELFARFNYTPKIGDTFDFVIAKNGITLASGLEYLTFVTQAGKSALSGLSFSHYASNIAADPDDLYRIAENLFSFQLAENGTVLQGTLVSELNVAAVPEPKQYVMLLLGLALMGWLRRRNA